MMQLSAYPTDLFPPEVWSRSEWSPCISIANFEVKYLKTSLLATHTKKMRRGSSFKNCITVNKRRWRNEKNISAVVSTFLSLLYNEIFSE